MLVLRSDHSLTSVASDRMAVNKADALAKAAAKAGWTCAALCDERTMAGSLDFLSACAKAKITGTAGMTLARLATSNGLMSLTIVALDQAGLERIVKVSHLLSEAKTLPQALACFEPSPQGGAAPGRNVAFLLHPARGFTAQPDPTLREEAAARRIGLAIALYDVNGQEARHAPQDVAKAMSAATGIPLALVRGGYAVEPITEALASALNAITKNKASVVGRTEDTLPQSFVDATIPPHDPADYETPAGRNATSIVSRIAPMRLDRKPTLPSRIGLEGEAADAKLERLTRAGMEDRFASGRIADTPEARARLETELALILKLGFSNYFLIMREAIQYARDHDIPVGPGRGSAAGSIVAYALGLTDIDPIRHKLFFERFINPERISLPDIDTDFCENRRLEVIEHVARFYGDERVAHIATYGMRQPRGALRDAGRALGLRGASNDAVAYLKARSAEKDNSDFEKILADHPDGDVRRVLAMALRLKGLSSNVGIHAGGIVISDDAISSAVPVSSKRSDNGRQIIEFDMKGTEKAGLVKFDFLGLKTLTVIDTAVKSLKACGIDVDIARIDDEDPDVYAMIRRGSTRTVFQLESDGMTRSAMDIGIDTFEDIVALVALYRPGPMGNIPIYGQRKKGAAKVEYLHRDLETILSDTHGVIIYQEQIMQLAQVWAGYSMAQADLLRRAIGKKIKEEVEAARQPFYERSAAYGRDEATTKALFEYIVPFAAYGFNRSHAAAYATLTYQTAWLKCHHPGAWYAANLTHEEEAEKRAPVIAEAARSGIRIADPSINGSQTGFRWTRSEGRSTIVLPLEAVKGVGAAAAAAVIAERDAKGPYKSMREFIDRSQALNKAQVEHLVYAGAFDEVSPYPPTVARPNLAKLVRETRQAPSAKRVSAQANLFGERDLPFLLDPDPTEPPMTPEKAAEMQQELLQGLLVHERRTIASAAWRRQLEDLRTLEQAANVAKTMNCNTMGIVTTVSDRMDLVPGSSAKQRVIVLTLEDETGRRTFDVGTQCREADALAASTGRAIRVTLAPSKREAMIQGRPEIQSAAIYRDPQEAPREHPVVVLEAEIDVKRRTAILDVLRAIAGTTAKRKPEPGSRAEAGLATSHILVVPPSNKVEIFPMPAKAAMLDMGRAFADVPGFVRYMA